jgi:dipeptidyl aminopeptidase/acylaminoacyl peptidase
MPHRRRRVLAALAVPVLAFGTATTTFADDGYRRPPEPIASVLEAPAFPRAFVAPSDDTMLLATPLRFAGERETARASLRLAGVTIDPATNALRGAPAYVAYQLVRIADGRTTAVELPAGARASTPVWSPDGEQFAFGNATARGTDLWIGSARTGELHEYADVHLNALFGDAIAWLPGSTGLLVHVIDANRPAGPPPPASGPYVREAHGSRGAPPEPADAVPAPNDGERFAYYARGTYAVFDLRTGTLAPLLPTGVYADASVSPSGKLVAFASFREPFASGAAWRTAAHRTNVVDRSGTIVAHLDDVVADSAAAGLAPPGPRDVSWQANAPATLVWIDGRPGSGDGVYSLAVGTPERPRAILGTADRLADIAFVDGTSSAIVRDYDRRTKTSRTFEFDVDAPSGSRPAIVGTTRDGDAFDDPGRPLERAGTNGEPVIARDGPSIFLAGEGYTTAGLRPFVDRVDVATQRKRRLFQSALDPLETTVAMLDPHGDAFLVQRQSPTQPPDYYVQTVGGGAHELRQLTHFVDPAAALRTLRRRVVSYKRADGVTCAFTLYLPPGAREGTPLPTLLWAYPYEFDDAAAASQNANFTQTYDEPLGPAARLAALAGYAVLDEVAMPIVGTPAVASDTLVAQLAMDARAAIDKAVQIGVTDRSRVAIGGHSYGAFMAATLLAHTNLFRAGIARSGAYNRTLTPFGFQNEPRTLWQAPEVYERLSPLAFADRIASPLLLIHGALDDNPATPPEQSERMYDAVRGNGGTVRLVVLPNETHTYASREAVETAEAETIDWLDRYVKAAADR